ncbi:MAG: hypothetical protein JW774_09250 [Candidatus Aureabacteria bacterium]|nr:hypothetical protein [Candidatus Auribacterota bacterium]
MIAQSETESFLALLHNAAYYFALVSFLFDAEKAEQSVSKAYQVTTLLRELGLQRVTFDQLARYDSKMIQSHQVNPGVIDHDLARVEPNLAVLCAA